MSQPVNETQKTESELVTSIPCVKIWLITGYNYDEHDIRCGGSRELGPWMWVIKSHKDEILAEMKKRYGNDHRVREIVAKGSKLISADRVPTVEEELATFEEFLKNPKAWRC